MTLQNSFPNYIEPCIREKSDSLESAWLSPSDFGECYLQPSDSQFYPCLTPVYNGEVLKIHPELLHASLSGISIKHIYGSCFTQFEEEESFFDAPRTEGYGADLFGSRERTPSISYLDTSSEDGTTSQILAEPENSFDDLAAEKPLCLRPNINYRNSFWNLHRPELCKLTWSQKYVSATIVIEYLHKHLLTHGFFCDDCHEEEQRIDMLNKELDEYGRLKELASPRELPPDENFFNHQIDDKILFKALYNPRCKNLTPLQKKPVINPKHRFLELSDDDDDDFSLHRSKEEFCLTIGKHIRKPPVTTAVIPCTGEGFLTPEICVGAEEEVGGMFFFRWQLYHTEQSFEGVSDETSAISSEHELVPIINPCPPLLMDDFCRAAAKADFSDLRCNPDDF